MNHKTTIPPETYDHEIQTPDGKTIACHSDGAIAGAWLALPGKDRALSVQSVKQGGTVENYVGYRAGHTKPDTIAIVVDAAGEVRIQVTLEYDYVKFLNLDQLQDFARTLP